MFKRSQHIAIDLWFVHILNLLGGLHIGVLLFYLCIIYLNCNVVCFLPILHKFTQFITISLKCTQFSRFIIISLSLVRFHTISHTFTHIRTSLHNSAYFYSISYNFAHFLHSEDKGSQNSLYYYILLCLRVYSDFRLSGLVILKCCVSNQFGMCGQISS